ncbi:MAG TPA: hypothetical protein VKR29_10490 [Candidatus Binataceae bacterium]|nr:hypothetical protein [Candidatus Binataceae bacterium]
MKRREFIKTGAIVVVGTAAVASGLVREAAASEQAMPKLAVLKPEEAQTLFSVARTIFPHKKVGDAPYWQTVADLDAAAKADPSVAQMLRDGVEQLNGPAKFTDLDPQKKVAALKAIETTPFFQKVRGAELQTLYSHPDTCKALGYQGAAYQYGGYIHRGFNDLDWLPNPPESASPKPA